MTVIVGAGLAGLIAGHIFPNAPIIERQPEPRQTHNALLRFRSSVVSDITGIPFRRVTVRKGVWSGMRYTDPTIALANAYSRKCTGRLLDRSVWDVAPVERFIAPEDFYAQLVMACHKRISWDTDIKTVTAIDGTTDHLVSTIPLPDALTIWGVEGCAANAEFHRAPISVRKLRVADSDVHQTVYFPDPDVRVYRASITGSLLIVEAMSEPQDEDMRLVLRAFELDPSDVEPLSETLQRFGKIAPINNKLRKEFIHRLTTESGVYSVGRFATWRNILLDDVVKDLRIVKGMIEQNDTYTRKLNSI